MNTNGNRMKLYHVEDERAYDYPKLLLERILNRKKQNHGLETELKKLRRELTIIQKESLVRRLQKAVVAETIELT